MPVKMGKFLLSFLLFCPLFGVDVVKKGLNPLYPPNNIALMAAFLPYNAKALLVGDKIAFVTDCLAGYLPCGTLYCFCADEENFAHVHHLSLGRSPQIHPFFGLLHSHEGTACFYTSNHVAPPEEWSFRIPGSLLRPTNPQMSALFGSEKIIPTYSVSHFCETNQKVELLYLDSGGTEGELLQEMLGLVRGAIIIFIKTYHSPFREGLTSFDHVNRFLSRHDFVLFSHYKYDSLLGDALYVKRKYYRALFCREEL